MPTAPPSRARRLSARLLRDALETIAQYPLAVHTVRWRDADTEMVRADDAEYLRTIARDVLARPDTQT